METTVPEITRLPEAKISLILRVALVASMFAPATATLALK